jgi:hypothetical protein
MMDDLQIVMSIIGVIWELQGGGEGKMPLQYFFYLKIDFMALELKRGK